MTQSKIFRAAPVQLSEGMYSEEGGVTKKIQILKVGKFFDAWEDFEVTKDDLTSMVKNFNERKRKIDLMVDFSHDSGGPAAAWMKNIYTDKEGTELWADVEWTPSGEEAVKSKAFRYLSADFSWNYMDNETGEKCGPTLFGAGLTNRPVLKNMQPTTLSEEKTSNKDEKMTEAELKKKNEELEKQLADQKAEADKLKKEAADRALLDEKSKREAEEKKAADEKARLLSEKKAKFDKKLSEGLVVEAQRDAFMNDNMEEFMEKAVKVQNSTSGNGDSGAPANTGKSAQDQVLELAEKKVKEDKIQLSEAIGKVLSENKELNEKYIKETTPHRA